MEQKSKYDVGNGIHRVPLWRIGGFALNNTATNLYLFSMTFIAYFITGWVGLGVVLAGSFSMIMRLWDGVTDPFIGFILDKTDGKLGKNRPFMIIGNIILFCTSFLIFHVTPRIAAGGGRIAFFILMNLLYYIGYTFQCVVTKSAQSCLTNDPKQRPVFAIFDAIYNIILFMGLQIIVASVLAPKYGGFTNDPGIFHEIWLIVALGSIVCTAIAVISIWPKDNRKYFGTGEEQHIKFKDYAEVLKNNRAIQMLVLSASTDKLANSAKTGVVTVIMYGIVAGAYSLSGTFSLVTSLISIPFIIVLAGYFAGKLGQRKIMIVCSWVALIGNILMALLWLLGDPKTLRLPGMEGFTGLSFFTVALFILTIITSGFMGVSSQIVIPMTADCADYETYRTGKYVPGLMGTLFSFVDKLISSLAPFITSLCVAAIGFRDVMPDVDTPYTTGLRNVGVFVMYGLVSIGLICNIIAMKFYPLTQEKMTEIREKIADIKAQHEAENGQLQ